MKLNKTLVVATFGHPRIFAKNNSTVHRVPAKFKRLIIKLPTCLERQCQPANNQWGFKPCQAQHQIAGTNLMVPEPAGFQDYKTSNLNNFRAFAIGKSSNRWGRSWYTTTPKQSIDKALSFCERTGEKCTIYAVGDTIVKDMSPTEILAAAEEYYSSVSPGGAKLNEYHLIGTRLTAK